MEAENVLVIIWMVIVGIVAIFLIGFIIRFIHNKPPINITLVDLIYCELLCWMLLADFMYISGVVVCHSSPRYFE